jgi:hypothetical protein
VLNYSRRPGSDNPIIYLKSPWRTARFVGLETAAPVPLQFAAQASSYEVGGAELSLPFISVYGAVQMEA